MPNAGIKPFSLPYQVRVPATSQSATAQKIYFATNQQMFDQTQPSGVGPGGWAAAVDELSGALLPSATTLSRMSARLNLAMPSGQSMTLKLVGNSGSGFVDLGPTLVFTDATPVDAVSFGPLALNAAVEVAVVITVSDTIERLLSVSLD